MYLTEIISKENFIKMYKTMNNTEMAKKLGVSRWAILHLARQYGLEHKKKGGFKPRKTIKINLSELKTMYETMTTKDMAKKLNVSIVTLLKVLKEQGIKMKKPGNRTKKLIVEG